MIFYTNVSHILHPDSRGCRIWVWFEALSGHILIMAVEILLIMRSMSPNLLMTFNTDIYIYTQYMHSIVDTTYYLQLCFASSSPSTLCPYSFLQTLYQNSIFGPAICHPAFMLASVLWITFHQPLPFIGKYLYCFEETGLKWNL